MTTLTLLDTSFFDCDPSFAARNLIGKILCHRTGGVWLHMRVVETEAYYLHEKGSHASLGYTYKRRALFMPAGTIYMYYARGGDSFNISCRGRGNALLIKAGTPADVNAPEAIKLMLEQNPVISSKGERKREIHRLCSGQTLLCRSMGLKVSEFDASSLTPEKICFKDDGYRPQKIITGLRHGIPKGRDEDLPLRFFDFAYLKSTTTGRMSPGHKG